MKNETSAPNNREAQPAPIELCVRQREVAEVKLWWVCRIIDGKPRLVVDQESPRGYGFQSRARAEWCATELEQKYNAKGVSS